jgi:hypothetical protein
MNVGPSGSPRLSAVVRQQALAALMLAQHDHGGGVQGDGALPGLGLRRVEVGAAVGVGDLLVDRECALGEVEVGPAQRAQFAAA